MVRSAPPELRSGRLASSTMCTIIALHRLRSDLPLVIAANRDELRARAALAPAELGRAPRRWGGRDAELGGSWMGVSERGLFVGLTNQRTERAPDRQLRSRGEVVVEALGCADLRALERFVRQLDVRRYNPFNLLFGDGQTLWVAYARPSAATPELVELPPGLHVLANDRLGSPWFPKVERARALVEPYATAPWEVLRPSLGQTLGDHAQPAQVPMPERVAGMQATAELVQGLQALCVHLPGYGTTSATLLALGQGRIAHYSFAAGPPCCTAFEDQSELLAMA